MRTTLNLDKSRVDQAVRMTGVAEKTALIHMGLESLIAREPGPRLAQLGGSEPSLQTIHRRKTLWTRDKRLNNQASSHSAPPRPGESTT